MNFPPKTFTSRTDVGQARGVQSPSFTYIILLNWVFTCLDNNARLFPLLNLKLCSEQYPEPPSYALDGHFPDLHP
jgi:hypothetical protein